MIKCGQRNEEIHRHIFYFTENSRLLSKDIMKKILFVIGILTTSVSFCQTTVRFGVLADANYSGSGMGTIGLDAGGLIESSFNRPDSKLRLQLEARYSQINNRYEDLRIRTQQIDIPLLAKYFIFPSLSVNAGPVFNFNLSTQANGLKFYSRPIDNSNHVQTDLAAGFTYYLKHRLFIDFRYSNIFGRYEGSLNKYALQNGFQYKINTIQIGVGIRFAPIITDFIE